jgi:MtN3 and saliva related transmembrane protein
MTLTDAIGWFASAILVATVSRQVWKQWRERRIDGVSSWLFLGQIATSAAFLLYSWLLENWIFVTSNLFLLVAAVTGEVLRRRIESENAITNPPAESGGEPREPR